MLRKLVNLPLFIIQLCFLQLFGEFGYDCHKGQCYGIPTENWTLRLLPDTVLNIIASTLPCLIIVISYARIWFEMLQNSRYLKKHGTRYLGVLATLLTYM